MTMNWLIEESLIKGLFSKSWHALGVSGSAAESSRAHHSWGLAGFVGGVLPRTQRRQHMQKIG